MKKIEESKVESMAQIQIAVSAKKIAPQHAPMLMEMHKLRAFDKLFAETGVEEEDITKAFLKYQLAETAEFKAMMEKSKNDIKNKIQEFMMRARAQQAAMQQQQF
jgi:hypothetical protein